MTRAQETPPHAARPAVMITVLCFAGAVSSYSQSVILLPIAWKLPAYLETSRDNASWVLTVTLLVAAVSLPTGGRLADLFGKRRVITVALMSLLVGSTICALSDTLLPLIIGRAFQGVTLVVIPVGVSLLRELVPADRVPGAIATMSASLGLGAAVGLPLAAWIPEHFDWHALFWVSTGLAALALALVRTQVRESTRRTPGTVDVVGTVGLAIALVCLLLVISKGQSWGWSSDTTIGFGVTGAVVLIAWAAYELRCPSPLVNLRLAARPVIAATNVVSFLIGFTLLGMLLVSPYLMQIPHVPGVLDHGMGQSVFAAGLWVAPAGFAMLAMSPVSARMIPSIGAKPTLMIGTAVMGLGYLFVIIWMNQPWQIMTGVTITFAGLGIAYAAMLAQVMSAVPIGEAAAANGLNSLMRSIGTSTASTVVTVVLAASTVTVRGHAIPVRSAFDTIYLIGAIAAVVGVVLIAFIPGRRTAPTGQGRAAPASVISVKP